MTTSNSTSSTTSGPTRITHQIAGEPLTLIHI